MNRITVTIIACLLIVNALQSQDGILDESFGNQGSLVYNHFNASSGIQSIVRAGDFLYAAGFTKPQTRELFSILKVDLQGEPVAEFGEQGVLRYPIGSGFGRADIILVQPDGKLVAGGWARNVNEDHYVLVRFHPDGSPDNSFGGDGMVSGLFDNSSFVEDEIYDAALLSDGRIIVVGKEYNGANNDGFLACFDETGVPCSGFGQAGVHIITFPEGIGDEEAFALAVDANENIYVGGRVLLELFEDASFFILKYDSQGVADNTFGEEGKVIHTIPDILAGLRALAIDGEGRILTGGSVTEDSDADFFMTRYLPSGDLDPDFGDGGVTILPGFGNEGINDLLVQQDGKILAAGSTGGFPSEMFVVRVLANGTPDENFGDDGWGLASIHSGFNGIESITLGEDGSIYGGGFTYTNSVFHMALAKFNNSITALPPSYVTNNHISVFPNPVTDHATITFSALKELKLSVFLMTQDGKVIRQLAPKQFYSAGDHDIPFAVQHESPGYYFLLVELNEHTLVLPFQKM